MECLAKKLKNLGMTFEILLQYWEQKCIMILNVIIITVQIRTQSIEYEYFQNFLRDFGHLKAISNRMDDIS